MALSAQDVHDKQFKLVRNSTGYDMDEVDAFLDEVEAEVARLGAELSAAREQLEAVAPADHSAAAAHILEMAQRTADEYVAEARKAAKKSVKKIEAQRRELEDRVAALRTFEIEIRSRLTSYFESQLADLQALADDA
jgi:DivIVA domain-containing protein